STIEQHSYELNNKVSYTEMNGTNKTLEKLLTEFSQTADGFNFRIDSNGMIQDLTFDRNAFKLNSNLIEFNEGDVVIIDVRATIKDAFIHIYVSNNAFINVLNSQYINSNEVTSEVGGNKTTIRCGFFESSGTYQRTWLGITTANQIDIRSENGYLRFRNNTLDRSIYMSDYGVSTMRDATGDYLDADGSSGSLLFWDPRYSPNGAYGLTVNSYGGVVALESDNNRIVLNSESSSNIESRNNVINITPHSQQTSRGFRFTKSTDYLDGYLVFGDVNQRGLRFNRSTSGLVQVVDANRNTGGDTAIEAGDGIFNTVRARDGSNYLNLHN